MVILHQSYVQDAKAAQPPLDELWTGASAASRGIQRACYWDEMQQVFSIDRRK